MADKDYDLTDEEKELEAAAQQEPEEEETAPEPEGKEAHSEAPEGAEEVDEDGKPKKGYVPLSALDSERHKRKDVERELSEMRQTLEHQKSVFDKLMSQRQGEEQPPEEDMPDPVLEPEKFKGWLKEQQNKVAEPYQQMERQSHQQRQQMQAFSQLKNYAEQHEQAFKQQYPENDYDGALQFAREKKAEEFKLWGYNDQQAQQAVAEQEALITAMAAQRGQSPAAFVYNFALLHGYQPKGKQSDAERVERLGATQRKTQSMSTAAGQPRGEELTMEKLARMSESELAKISDEEIAKVMGG